MIIDNPRNLVNLPLAANGLKSFRCKGRFGYIMIGARTPDEAHREALRSSDSARREDIEKWSEEQQRYVPCMTREQAESIVRHVWPRAFARPAALTVNEKGDIIEGPQRYQVGYYRTGKKGARLSTVKGDGDTYEAALADALVQCRGLSAELRLASAMGVK